jgi:hypothetical protein
MHADTLRRVDAARRADVALDVITAARRQWQSDHRRPQALTAREALVALQFEATFVWVAAQNLSSGTELSDDDLRRLTLACRRVHAIAEEFSR